MEVLNDVSLSEALLRCNGNKGYKVVLVFARLLDAKNFANELLEELRTQNVPGVKQAHIGSYIFEISFTNGSLIKLISLPQTTTRDKYNEIIYNSDVDIEDDRIRALLQCMLVPYSYWAVEIADGHPMTDAARIIDSRLWRHKSAKEVFEHSEELDEFLSSYPIIK